MPRDPFPATRSTLIGPNAILQMAEALRAAGGEELTERLFLEAGLGTFLLAPPEEMVGEELVARLHETVAEHLASEEARMIAVDAGRRTARYILANRIPLVARFALKSLPARLAGRKLLDAIARHAWTFAGSGEVTVGAHEHSWSIEIAPNPIATPGCPWHLGVFEELFGTLVTRSLTVTHPHCCAEESKICRFEIRAS